MIFFFAAIFFALGLIIGSFLNVLVLRHGTGLGYRGRSFCFVCGRILRIRELIPLFSFLFQKRRCVSCKSYISWQYPLVELFTGVLFVGIFLKLFGDGKNLDALLSFQFPVGQFALLVYYSFLLTLLFAIALYDFRHKIIPDVFVYMFVALSLFAPFLIHNSTFIIPNLFAGPLFALPFALLWLFSKGRLMGLGDAKLAWGIGWLLGLSGGAAALIAAFWTAAVAGLFLIGVSKFFIFKGKSRLFPSMRTFTIKSEIPFAPFMILGTLATFFFDISFADMQSLLIF